MQLYAYRNTERSAQTSVLVQRRKDELRQLEVRIESIQAEVKTKVAWAEAEALRIIEAARKEAARLTAIEEESRPDVGDIVRAIALKHMISPAIIIGPRRDRAAVAARYEAMALAYQRRPDLSLSQIARYFGNRDHTTIIHAVQKMGVWRGGK